MATWEAPAKYPAGTKKNGTNFILISLCFFSLAFTKAVGSNRGARPPETVGGGGGGSTPSLHSASSSHPQGREGPGRHTCG
jgi:hypothetical protein